MKFLPIKQILNLNPVVLGLGISGTLLFGLLIQVYLLDRFTVIFGPVGTPHDDFRIAVFHCLLAGYLPGAYLFLLRGTRNTVDELEKILKPAEDPSCMDYSTLRLGKRALIISGLIGLLGAVLIPHLTTPSPWDPSTWNPEVWWHRVLGLFIGLCFAWLCLAVWNTSTITSRLAARIDSLDLLDMTPLSPFVNQGLLTALLMIGLVSLFSLFLLEPEHAVVVAILVGLCLPLALLSLWLPVRGVHQRICEAKQAELKWTRERIQQSRTLLHSDSPDVSAGRMADLSAYHQLIEDVPGWPFKSATVLRVMLYLLIPVASWLGGLLIEGVLDQLFM